MYTGLLLKYQLFLFEFKNLNFLYRFSKNTRISNFMKFRPMEAELFHADGRTDMTKLIVAFSSFANAPKIVTNQCIADTSKLEMLEQNSWWNARNIVRKSA